MYEKKILRRISIVSLFFCVCGYVCVSHPTVLCVVTQHKEKYS